RLHEAFVNLDQRISNYFVSVLQCQNLFFYRILGNKLRYKNITTLSDTMRAIYRLHFYCSLQPMIQNKYIISLHKIQSYTNRYNRYQENIYSITLPEFINHFFAVLGSSIQIGKCNVFLLKILSINFHLSYKLRKNQNLMPSQ